MLVTAYLRLAENVLKEWHTVNIQALPLLCWFNITLLIVHFIAACYKSGITCSKMTLESLTEAKTTTGELKNCESTIFWDATPCILVEDYQYSGGTHASVFRVKEQASPNKGKKHSRR
jgi:hypothetical protein